ncbi:hypothetical protein SISNIDRAFT_483144 [Sistotremastrum niveocremeum HHB9708]|uniref:Uncharacterized protein n=1 Tax=Sistotremastrum niveocremeum HHB9708 TaxID=1314777 RepID=A0A164Y556_9AGAM|nr:hypothetical protein SISNIDRAFT_483144 [Sistotremastrum niveocremeum HHB9708]
MVASPEVSPRERIYRLTMCPFWSSTVWRSSSLIFHPSSWVGEADPNLTWSIRILEHISKLSHNQPSTIALFKAFGDIADKLATVFIGNTNLQNDCHQSESGYPDKHVQGWPRMFFTCVLCDRLMWAMESQLTPFPAICRSPACTPKSVTDLTPISELEDAAIRFSQSVCPPNASGDDLDQVFVAHTIGTHAKAVSDLVTSNFLYVAALAVVALNNWDDSFIARVRSLFDHNLIPAHFANGPRLVTDSKFRHNMPYWRATLHSPLEILREDLLTNSKTPVLKGDSIKVPSWLRHVGALDEPHSLRSLRIEKMIYVLITELLSATYEKFTIDNNTPSIDLTSFLAQIPKLAIDISTLPSPSSQTDAYTPSILPFTPHPSPQSLHGPTVAGSPDLQADQDDEPSYAPSLFRDVLTTDLTLSLSNLDLQPKPVEPCSEPPVNTSIETPQHEHPQHARTESVDPPQHLADDTSSAHPVPPQSHEHHHHHHDVVQPVSDEPDEQSRRPDERPPTPPASSPAHTPPPPNELKRAAGEQFAADHPQVKKAKTSSLESYLDRVSKERMNPCQWENNQLAQAETRILLPTTTDGILRFHYPSKEYEIELSVLLCRDENPNHVGHVNCRFSATTGASKSFILLNRILTQTVDPESRQILAMPRCFPSAWPTQERLVQPWKRTYIRISVRGPDLVRPPENIHQWMPYLREVNVFEQRPIRLNDEVISGLHSTLFQILRADYPTRRAVHVTPLPGPTLEQTPSCIADLTVDSTLLSHLSDTCDFHPLFNFCFRSFLSVSTLIQPPPAPLGMFSLWAVSVGTGFAFISNSVARSPTDDDDVTPPVFTYDLVDSGTQFLLLPGVSWRYYAVDDSILIHRSFFSRYHIRDSFETALVQHVSLAHDPDLVRQAEVRLHHMFKTFLRECDIVSTVDDASMTDVSLLLGPIQAAYLIAWLAVISHLTVTTHESNLRTLRPETQSALKYSQALRHRGLVDRTAFEEALSYCDAVLRFGFFSSFPLLDPDPNPSPAANAIVTMIQPQRISTESRLRDGALALPRANTPPSDQVIAVDRFVRWLTQYYGYIPRRQRPLAGHCFPSISAQRWSELRSAFGAASEALDESIPAEAPDIAQFYHILLSQDRSDHGLCDLFAEVHEGRLDPDTSTQAITRVLAAPSAPGAPRRLYYKLSWSAVSQPLWELFLFRPTDVVHLYRSRFPNVIVAAWHLLEIGIPFSTMLPRRQGIQPPNTPTLRPFWCLPTYHEPILFVQHMSDFTASHYTSYERQCNFVLSRPGARSALLEGGILNRIARDYVSFQLALDGPSTDASVFGGCAWGFHARGPQDFIPTFMFDDRLSPDVRDVLLGRYIVRRYIPHSNLQPDFADGPGYSHVSLDSSRDNPFAETSVYYWPPDWFRSQNSRDFGHWTPANERWFRTLQQSYQSGQGTPLRASEWHELLRRPTSAGHSLKSLSDAFADEFTQSFICM